MALSTFGAAAEFDSYLTIKDWLYEADRSIEIQDFVTPDVIAGECDDLIRQYQIALDGHKCLRGIHGPFFGLELSNPDRSIRAVIQARFLKGLEIAEALGGPIWSFTARSPCGTF